MEMEYMTIGGCLDYINEYIEQNKKENNKQEKVRRGKQSDFDSF